MEKRPLTLGHGVHGPTRELSWAEQRLQDTKPTGRKRSRRMAMTSSQRAHVLSEKHIALLAENRRRMKLRGEYPSTKGVMQGWAGKANRKRLRGFQKIAQEEAKLIMAALIEKGVVDKDSAGNDALEFGIEVIKTKDGEGKPIYNVADRLKAARMVLDFTMAKPEQKTKVTVESAEDWLTALGDKDTPAE